MHPCLQTTSHDQVFLLPLPFVRELTPLSPYPATEGTSPGAMIRGWSTYHGTPIPVINITWAATVHRIEIQPHPSHLAVLCIYGSIVGLETQGIGRIVHPTLESLLPPSPHLSHDQGVLACYAKTSEELIPLLDLHGLLRRQAEKSATQAWQNQEPSEIRLSYPPDEAADIPPLVSALSQSGHRILDLNQKGAACKPTPIIKAQVALSLGRTTSVPGPRHPGENGPACRITAAMGAFTNQTRALAYLNGFDLLVDLDPKTAAAEIKSAIDLYFMLG
jgi:chemotaxis signal transduction protein